LPPLAAALRARHSASTASRRVMRPDRTERLAATARRLIADRHRWALALASAMPAGLQAVLRVPMKGDEGSMKGSM